MFVQVLFVVLLSTAVSIGRPLRHKVAVSEAASTTYPVVLWHGMGDTCCFPFSMGRIQDLIKQHLPGIYTYSVEIGSSEEADEFNGFFMNANDQVTEACSKIASDPNLASGFNAIGFSQGSQFLRAYVERCNSPPVQNLISIGGQHQGVYGFPRCPGNVTFCNWVRELLDLGAYEGFVQNHLAQADYWHDPTNEDEYVKSCIFLPDINNELPQKNATYKTNMIKLNKFAMVRFTEDGMVVPIASEWFGYYKPGQAEYTIDMRSTELYQQDWIGLKELDQQGKIDFLSVVGDHLQFTDEWFIQNVISTYLNSTIPKNTKWQE